MTTEITRKTGDTLIIKGVLDGDNLPDAASWVGAVARINIEAAGDIKNASGTVVYEAGDVVVDHAAVTSLNTTTREFEYKGAALTYAGAYRYEIEVTFQDGTVLTWPNDGHEKLRLKEQIA